MRFDRWSRYLTLALIILAAAQLGYGQSKKFLKEPACSTLTPASAGGPMPRDASVMVLRYLGTSNYEVAFRGKVLLLDAFFDGQRGPDARLIGLRGDAVKKADAIFIGHPHIDHIADAPSIAKRLKSTIFVAPAGRPVLEREGVGSDLIRYVKGGESIKMAGYTVYAALARHSNLDPKITAKYRDAAFASEPPSPEEIAYITALATYNPSAADNPELDIPLRGTIAYGFIFDNGFKLAFRDSPGAVTDGEREMMARLGGSVDVAVIAHQGYGAKPVLDVTLALTKVYNPKIFLPAHHDRLFAGITDFSTTPLFTVFRDELPNIKGIDPMYRSPICVDTKSGEYYYGQNVR
jgi:L-ascorbate metabolism protein UlaG (beta-lactamase superfamily)